MLLEYIMFKMYVLFFNPFKEENNLVSISSASFFERMKFIIEDKGLQSYVEKAGFNER